MDRLPRIFCNLSYDEDLVSGLEFLLPKDDSHYLRDVLRLKPGSKITLISKKSSREFEAVVIELKDLVLTKIEREHKRDLSYSRVQSLSFALSKGAKNDFVCEKCTELGVKNIFFWQSERSVVKIENGANREHKLKRLIRIAESAARQSQQNEIPAVTIVSGIQELWEGIQALSGQGDRYFYGSLSPSAQEIRNLQPPSDKLHLLIGPEGDLTEEENKFLSTHGFEPINFGPYVLRSETAAVVAVAAIHSVWGFTKRQL